MLETEVILGPGPRSLFPTPKTRSRFSRDDAGKFLGAYYDHKIYENDPFAKLDQTGVGKLMEMAVKDGKAVRAKLHCGICGEHGGVEEIKSGICPYGKRLPGARVARRSLFRFDRANRTMV